MLGGVMGLSIWFCYGAATTFPAFLLFLLWCQRSKLKLWLIWGAGLTVGFSPWILSRTIQLSRSKDDATALFEVYGKSLGELLAFRIENWHRLERAHRTRSVGQQLVPCALSRSALWVQRQRF